MAGNDKLTPFAKTDKKPQDQNSGVQCNRKNNLIDNRPFMAPPGSDCTCAELEKHKM
jgi:hypothetical protein